jgi:hypothetical protein
MMLIMSQPEISKAKSRRHGNLTEHEGISFQMRLQISSLRHGLHDYLTISTKNKLILHIIMVKYQYKVIQAA